MLAFQRLDTVRQHHAEPDHNRIRGAIMADAQNTSIDDARKRLCPGCGKPLHRAGDPPSKFANRKHCSVECSRACRRRLRRDPKERFEEKVDRSPGFGPKGDCHRWTAAIGTHGYGTFEMDGPKVAHRVSYQLYCGEIPDDMQVLHRCDNRQCVNPDHFFLGSQADNIDDMMKKGRAKPRIGSRARSAKLTEADVIAILSDPRPHHELAKLYGVSSNAIIYIRNGRSWKHMPRQGAVA